MNKKTFNALDKINRSNMFEIGFLCLSILLTKVFSILKIFFLRLRGYKINYSVEIRNNVVFFQSFSKSIVVGNKTRIGSGARIKSGFGGKIVIGENVVIDDYSFISAQNLIEIGDETMIAAFSYIVDFNHKPLTSATKNLLLKTSYESKPVIIGKYVWIGANVIILPGVTIGDNSIIGAGAVVTRNIPRDVIAVGNPARVIKNVGTKELNK